MSLRTYSVRGSVRGDCGHRHRWPQTAAACALLDQRDCGSLGGGAYSDRSQLVAHQGGNEYDPTPSELHDFTD